MLNEEIRIMLNVVMLICSLMSYASLFQLAKKHYGRMIKK